jgi:general secretion pathway protein K
VRGEKGFALVLALIVTALLVAVLAEFIHEVYVDTTLHRNRMNGEQASLLAQSGVNGAMAALKVAGASPAMLQLVLAKPLEIPVEEGTVSVTVEEEEGKLNVNRATLPNGLGDQYLDPVETRLLKRLALPPQLHDSLADWIDTNGDPRSDGAETPYYRGLATKYDAKNGPLDTVGEIALVKGFTPQLAEALRPYITVYPRGGYQIDVNAAPQKLIEALDEGITPEMAKEIVNRRVTKPFANVGDLATVAGMEAIATRLAGIVSFRGTTFRLVSRATVGGVTRIVEAVVPIGGNPLYWREY